jgi:hypothetical protein
VYPKGSQRWNMVWKQDLAKLKQSLGDTAGPPQTPVPKPISKPAHPLNLMEEDDVFLSAMGVRRAATQSDLLTSAPASPTPKTETDFQAAMLAMKGVKPVEDLVSSLASSEPKAAEPLAAPLVSSSETEPETLKPGLSDLSHVLEQPKENPISPSTAQITAPQTAMPARIQLAAGMAIEVDGSLDLRAHSVADAMERLRDRLADGLFLGWRSLHVTLGSDESLHLALRDLLETGSLSEIARYAQAPIPMGGGQAWILYYNHPVA